MDISYLLLLQDFRHHIADAWTPFMHGTSQFVITFLVFFPVFIYWCVNKRKGLFILASFFLSGALNVLLKLTACVYRPWIKDPRIIPAGNSIHSATGYSFPSGHTAWGATLYGGLATVFWKQKSTKWLSVLCIIGILLTGFSRNYLGVHTPQDVLVGMLLGGGCLWLMWKIFAYVEKHPEHENYFLLGGILACVLALIYIALKPYPLDYVDGKLLVNPKHMINDGYTHIGALATFCVARYIEKRWIRFQPTGWNWKGMATGAVGLVALALMILFLRKHVIALLGPHWGRFGTQFIIVMFAIALWPWVLKLICRKK